MMIPQSRVDNSIFDPRSTFDRGRPLALELLWYFLKMVFFLSAIPWPARLRSTILSAFGARIGKNVYIKPRVNIHFPWKLSLGDNSWVGEGVEIYNFEPVTIGANCCLSQRALLCAANHDYRDPAMSYRNAPITIHDGAWVGACSFVAPGVSIGVDAVISAGSVVTTDLPHGMVCTGNPCAPVRARWKQEKSGKSDAPLPAAS